MDKNRIIKSLEWMIQQFQWQADNARDGWDEGAQGGYSPELLEAMEVLEELKRE